MEEELKKSETENSQTPSQPQKSGSKLWIWVAVSILVVGVFAAVWILLGNIRTNTSETSTATTTDKNESSTLSSATDYSGPCEDQSQCQWSKMSQGPYKDKVSFAIGTSPTMWTDSEKILAEHASVPDALLKDGILYVYFVDVATDGYHERLGLVKSSDNGATWSEKEIIKIDGQVGIAVDPAPFLLDDGRIRMYYYDISVSRVKDGTKNNTIYSAISTDGVNFTQEEGYRFRYADIFDPELIKIGNSWRMYVGSENKVLSATSSDGLTFEYEGLAYSGGAIPSVLLENGIYYLYTGGIGIATSSTGKTFSPLDTIIQFGEPIADPGVVKLDNGSFFMVYKINTPRN